MRADLHYGPLTARQALSVAGMRGDHREWLRTARPRLKFEADGRRVHLLLEAPDAGAEEAAQALLAAANAAGARLHMEDLRRPGEPDRPALGDGLGALLYAAAEERGGGPPAEPVEGLLLVLVPVDQTEGAEAALAELARADSAPLIGAAHADGQLWATLVFENDARRGSLVPLLSDLRQRFAGFSLVAHATDAGFVFLPEGLEVGHALIDDFSRAWRNLGLPRLPDAEALAILKTGDGVVRRLHQITVTLPATPGAALETVAPTTVEVLATRLEPDGQALAALNARIAEASPSAGYRLRLDPMPMRPRKGESVEQLQRRRMEIEERIDILQAMESSRPRLLRFGYGQLPALADALTRLPVEAVDGGLIRYAFAANTVDRAGCHWILYEPGDAVERSFFPYWHWQREGEAPLAYWVDPHWPLEAPADTGLRVFVPEGRRLTPPLRAAATVDFDAYVRRQLTFWIDYAAAQIDVPQAPLVVFGPGASGDALTVEVLDAAAFRPIRERLPWINENLVLREAFPAGDAFVAEAATAAGRARVLEQLQAMEETAMASLDERAATLRSEIEEGLAALLDRLSAEIETTLQSTAEAVDFIEGLSARIARLDGVVHAAIDYAETADATAFELPTDLSAFEEDCRRLAADLRGGLSRGLTMKATAENRLQNVEARLEDLRRRIDSVR